ncbi:MAG: sodium:proton antiporter [Planctomycetes bacterium]|nr:sodium:proton antiporter [Planctomycetota bacterium]
MPAPLTGLPALALVLGLGAALQWGAWRLRIPAILFLLCAGFLVGPVLGLLDPDQLFGSSFRPLVSLAVGLILFEGGLTLRFDELRGSGAVVRNLVTLGVAVTWVVSTLAGIHLAGVDFDVALLVGAILVLTGPTVVIPLVRHVRPHPPLGPILRWEGILVDPIGAVLALLVLQALASPERATVGQIGLAILRTLLYGGGLGVVAALGLARTLERFVVPDMLHVPVTLGAVAVTFGLANGLQPEAGLLAVTVMGIVLANRRSLDLAHIAEWKEHLATVLLSVLFLCIAARLSLDDLTQLGWRAVLYTAALILVARPLAVLASTVRSRLPWRDRVFLMAMAPRGIVVAAVTSEFSLHYEQSGHANAAQIVALVFPVIVLTVLFYGIVARPLARRLGVAAADPQGVLLVGADLAGRELGCALHDQGFDVLLVDTNPRNAAAARTLGLRTWHGSVLSTRFAEEAELAGIGSLVAMTPSSEVNRLALRQLQATFGRARLFRTANLTGGHDEQQMPGRVLFHDGLSVEAMRSRLQAGDRIRATKLTEQFGPADYAALYPPPAMPLAVVTPDRRLEFVVAGQMPPLRAGCTVLTLAPTATPAVERSPSDSQRG